MNLNSSDSMQKLTFFDSQNLKKNLDLDLLGLSTNLKTSKPLGVSKKYFLTKLFKKIKYSNFIKHTTVLDVPSLDSFFFNYAKSFSSFFTKTSKFMLSNLMENNLKVFLSETKNSKFFVSDKNITDIIKSFFVEKDPFYFVLNQLESVYFYYLNLNKSFLNQTYFFSFILKLHVQIFFEYKFSLILYLFFFIFKFSSENDFNNFTNDQTLFYYKDMILQFFEFFKNKK